MIAFRLPGRPGRLSWAASGTLLAAFALAALAGGCGGGDSSDASGPAVRPISEVLVGEVMVADVTATGAAVEVQTTIPMLCYVVFGTDETYGSQSTDPDMGGAPHTDHSAPLRGLQPDTLYHYQLQGAAPDGIRYVSEDLTFRTPPADDAGNESGQNVASATAGARITGVSSTYGDSDTWAAANAIDSDPATEWSSAGDGDAAFITVEFARAYDLKSIGFWTRTMGETSQVARFQAETDDGTVFGPFELPDADQMYTFPISTRTQSIRFQVIASSGGNTGAVEVAAFTDELE